MKARFLFLFLFLSSLLFSQGVSKEKVTKVITDSLKGSKVEAIEFLKEKGVYQAKVDHEFRKLLVTVDGKTGKINAVQEMEDPIFDKIREITNLIYPGEIIEKSVEREESEIVYVITVKGEDKKVREIEITISLGEPEEEEED